MTDNELEAANRAEAMVLLIRAGYRVKGRMTVNRSKYGQKSLWMLFPSTTFRADVKREW
jgi:hypothetical protein